ncbi:GtrA family protein, partial [candidate division KSB1 bacterium]|nr:GtrA family protein [candidate division KSB1 bacterium]
MNTTIKSILRNRVTKFALGGVINFLIKISVTFFLTEVIAIWYFGSYVISLFILIIFSFFYNAYITFNVRDNKRKNIIKYSIALIVLSFIDAFSVKLITEEIGVFYLASIVVVTGALFFVKFFVYKKIVFKKKRNNSQINGLLSPLLQKLRIKNAKRFFRGKSFLDIGCSLGEIIPHLPKDAEYVGIEGNEDY